MGVVYRARDGRLQREVAVKVLPPEFSTDPERLRRFDQEALAAGSLNHPNVVAIFDVGTHDGAPYVVSELLEGETLRDAPRPRARCRCARRSRSARRSRAASPRRTRKGIVHRDLKPENLFVTRDGPRQDPRLRAREAVAPRGRRRRGRRLARRPMTDAGTVIGTVGYMAPEQVRGEPADHAPTSSRSGCVLYEMATGERAVQAALAGRDDVRRS